ncbi:D-alanyl-D-alanine carboxypeptidase/D-alanyl-D-alanine-endopeptidase [Nocardiopsis algeriensis]|uniref:D-alanyl-D-alanine carboxypeptidase/D-alanyl-D-alanine endopeptidase n=1 Tax=Nocardiopsis algeriensis TaxID=1478215 RepID=UPI003B42BB7A
MPRVRPVRGEALLTLALLNIFVLIAGFVVLDVVEARPLPAEPRPVTSAEGVAAAEPAASTPADPERIADILHDPMSASGLEEGLYGYVLDAATGEAVFELGADTPATPASTTKIATAVAVLSAVGPDRVLSTEAHLDPAGGTVVLRGGGDATLTTDRDHAGYPPVATLEELAEKTAAALAGQGIDTVSVGYDDSLFTGDTTGPGWKPNYITEGSTAAVHALMIDSGLMYPGSEVPTRVPDPPLVAAEAFAGQLEDQGITVEGAPVEAVAAGDPIASVDSMPMTALVEHMMLASDNNMAENLGRVAAIETGHDPSFAGAAEATHQILDGLGIDGVTLSDNSGLSTENRITPRALVDLVRLASDPAHAELNAAITGLPTANSTGTLSYRGRYDEGSLANGAAGMVRGKTGTLNGVSALAGTIRDQEGNTYVFAFLANVPGVTGAQLDTLAAALSSCGCS